MKSRLLKIGLIGCCLIGNNLLAKELKIGYTNNIEKNIITDMITYCGGYVQTNSGYILTSYNKKDKDISNLIRSRKIDLGFIENQKTKYKILFPTYLEQKKFLFFVKDNKSLKDLKGKSVYVIKGYYDLKQINDRLKLGLKLTNVYKKVGMPMAVEVQDLVNNKYIEDALKYKYHTIYKYNKQNLKKQGYRFFEVNNKYKLRFIQPQNLLVTRNFRTTQPKLAIKSLKQCIINNKDSLLDYGKSDKWYLFFDFL